MTNTKVERVEVRESRGRRIAEVGPAGLPSPLPWLRRRPDLVSSTLGSTHTRQRPGDVEAPAGKMGL